MNEHSTIQTALQVLQEATVDAAPPETRMVSCSAQTEWSPVLLRPVVDHRFHLLAPGADIVVFFDHAGHEIGWRDDGRLGSRQPMTVDPERLRLSVIEELELAPGTRMGDCTPCQLPPVGWTQEAVLFVTDQTGLHRVLRVWVNPMTLQVIQCLFTPAMEKGGQSP